MVVYISVTILSVVFALLSLKLKPVLAQSAITSRYIISQKRKGVAGYYFSITLSFLPLFLIAAIRYYVGEDYKGYLNSFNLFASGRNFAYYEIGFRLLNKAVLIFTKDYVWLFIVISFLFCFFIYKSIYAQSLNPALSIFLLVTSGFYFYSMNGMRQCIATSIFFFAIQYIRSKEFKKYLFWILLASTIHYVALVYIPIYFIGKIRLSFRKTAIFLGASAIILPLMQKIIYYIIGFTKYSAYINSEYDTSERGYILPIINLGIIVFAYYYHNTERKENQDDTGDTLFLNIQIIAAFLSLCLGLFPLASRLFAVFFYSQIFLIPRILMDVKNKNMKLILIFVIVGLYSIYFIYTVGVQNANTVLPYQTIFDR